MALCALPAHSLALRHTRAALREPSRRVAAVARCTRARRSSGGRREGDRSSSCAGEEANASAEQQQQQQQLLELLMEVMDRVLGNPDLLELCLAPLDASELPRAACVSPP